MRRAICPGSFDPVTYGHLDVFRRAHVLFDEVLIGVGVNASKNALLSVEERIELLTQATADLPRARVVTVDGLLAEFCQTHEVTAIVKGIRSSTDLDYEMQHAQMNRQLTGIETVFLPTAAQWAFVSSTLVRQIAALDGDISEFVPPVVTQMLAQRLTQTDPEGER